MKKIFTLFGFIFIINYGFGQTTLINSAGDGGFETGTTVAANGWTSNGATNLWQIGNAPGGQTGVRCAYISNGGAGGTWTYTNSASKTSHLYRSVSFPAGETSITLSFKWKCQGESGYDRLLVYTNTAAPVSGTPASSTTAWGTAVLVGGPYNSNTTWQNVTITLPAALAGTTKNLIFTWQNDGSFGSNPPAAIDDVSLISSPPPPAPSNDLCAGATSLPCATTNLAGTTVNTTSVADPSGCGSNYGVWYTFVGDGQNTTISSTATFDHEMVISSGSCGSLTNITCEDAATSGGTETYTFAATNGVTYYVYIAHYSTSSSTTGTFTISRSCSAPPVAPPNDLCSGATNLPCGTSALAGTTVNSTNTAHGTACSELSISSGSCGTFTNVVCTDSPENHTFTTVNGVTYYVYVAYWTTGSTTGTFDISRSCSAPPAAPANDNCAGATALTVNPFNLYNYYVWNCFWSYSFC
ncbi:MAG: hypothetical protein HYU68_06135 [Bacteroidetes bacterium]|nr:hypothetical protein [Bacteroidota bacterium]